MNDSILVSVIIPVYNVEKYLSTCLDSVISQTYKNIEIILVDDGSTDSSSAICDNYANRDYRVNVYHIINHGVSYARNLGIDNSHGEYILFIDSDDEVSDEYIEQLIKPCYKENIDLVICNINDIYPDKVINRRLYRDLKGNLREDYIALLALIRGPWVKLYKKAIIKKYKIYFPENISLGEDQYFNTLYFSRINSYEYIDAALYNYYHRGTSLSSKASLSYFRQVLDVVKIKCDYFTKYNIKDYSIALSDIAAGCANKLIKAKDNAISYEVFYNEMRKLYDIIDGNINSLQGIQIFGCKKCILIISIKYKMTRLMWLMSKIMVK